MIEHCLPRPGDMEREWVLWVELWLRAVRHPGAAGRRPRAVPAAARVVRAPCSRRASRAGEFTIADVDATTDVLLGAIDGVGVRVLAGDPALDLDRARALLLGARVARGRGRGA